MAEYIDREQLGIGYADREVFENKGYADGWNAAIDIINKAPVANVAEVKRGKWIADDDGIVICSECGEEHDWDDFRPPYCDMCGARMNGERRNQNGEE